MIPRRTKTVLKMSLIEIWCVLLITAVVAGSSAICAAPLAASAKLAMSAAEISAQIRENGLVAIIQGSPVQITFFRNRYVVSSKASAAPPVTHRLPAGIEIAEAKFGSGRLAIPILTLGSDGVSTAGHVIVKPAAAKTLALKSCTVVRSVRGSTRTGCQ